MRFIIIIYFLLVGFFSFSQGFVYDTTVNKIALNDSISVIHILGKDSWNSLKEYSETPKTIVLNKKRNEILELIFHEGSDRNCYSDFRIRQTSKNENIKYVSLIIEDDHFESKSGIRLGLNQRTVEELLGIKLAQKQEKGKERILYFRKDITNDAAMKRYNMPVFYGEYIFQNNKLIEFSYGFEKM